MDLEGRLFLSAAELLRKHLHQKMVPGRTETNLNVVHGF